MNEDKAPHILSRREALKTAGKIAAGSALAGVSLPHVFAANDDPSIRLALIGCGGRGAGAVLNAVKTSTEQGPVRLHAMADVNEKHIEEKYDAFERREEAAGKIDVRGETEGKGATVGAQRRATFRPPPHAS